MLGALNDKVDNLDIKHMHERKQIQLNDEGSEDDIPEEGNEEDMVMEDKNFNIFGGKLKNKRIQSIVTQALKDLQERMES